jgi:hypothetical protein
MNRPMFRSMRGYATEAGRTCTVLPIENNLWRFYRLEVA